MTAELDTRSAIATSESETTPEFDAWYVNWGNGVSVEGWIVLAPAAEIEQFVVDARLDGSSIGMAVVDTPGPTRRFKFFVPCLEKFKPIDVVTARLRLYASHKRGPQEVEIKPNEMLLSWMAKVAFTDCIYQNINDVETAKFYLERLEQRFGPSLAADRGLEMPSEPAKDKNQDLTPLLHRVGTISKDRSAILGREGTIFLYEGNNALFTQYQQETLSEAGQALATQWATVISERIAFFNKHQIPFAQIVIPEKTFALQKHFPITIKTPTRLLAAVEAWAKDHPEICAGKYISAIDSFAAAQDAELYYQKTDSHFSARGAIATTKILLNALAAQSEVVARGLPEIEALLARVQSSATPTRLLTGDLATRFFGVPLFEEDLDIRYETLFGEKNQVVLHEHYKPPGGNLTNTRMIWHHPQAPLDLKVVAFANSFFERGGACTTLSWWFKHLCREFHMVWSREYNPKYVEDVKPDAVICQTIERFLTVVPIA